MKHLNLIAILLFLLAFNSCKENEMDTYQNDPAIYFSHTTDSIAYSFFTLNSDIPRDTVWVEALTMGLPANQNRPFALTQTNTNEPDAAVAGIHYVPFEDKEVKDSISIKAGAFKRLIPIILLRDKSLKTATKRLVLSVVSNEFFRPGITSLTSYTITTTDTAIKPRLWDSYWAYYLGESWGIEKMRFAIEATGYADFESRPLDPGLSGWMRDVCKQKLVEYNNTHEEVYQEADGTPVSFDY